MMGQQTRSGSLFYYFRLEDQIPKDHLLRVIDERIDLSFVREDLYSATGRPSIDPEVLLLRLLLVGYLYGITSERRLLEEVRMHLAYRWVTRAAGLRAGDSDHSTFSKNRHGCFRQSGVFQEVFEEIVRRCVQAGLVEGKHNAALTAHFQGSIICVTRLGHKLPLNPRIRLSFSPKQACRIMIWRYGGLFHDET